MTNPEKYKGIYPAFYACYEDDGSVSANRTRALARFLADSGVQGLYVGGSSGECIYQSVPERKLILESVLAEVKGRVRVIAHVGCNNTRDSAELAAHAAQAGADAVASIPPIYFRLPEPMILQYWNSISAAADGLDFFIYNIPQLAGTALTPSLLAAMLENPAVAGVKNSSPATEDILRFKTMGGGNFAVFNGPDEQFVSGLAMGACGGIGGTYAAMPELFLAAYRLMEAGDVKTAAALQEEINGIIYLLCTPSGSLYAGLKGVLRLRGVDAGGVRKPLLGLEVGDEAVVKQAHDRILAAAAQYC